MRRLAPAVALLLLLAACGDDNTPAKSTSTPPAEIMPLALGNVWWGTVATYESTPGTDTVQAVRWEIGGDTVINDETWYRFGEAVQPSRPVLSWLCNRDDGLWRLVRETDSTWAPQLEYKYPARVGDSFGVGITTTIVVAVDSAVTTGTGIHRCYVYRSLTSDGVLTSIRCVKPGLGLVAEGVEIAPYGGDTLRFNYILDSATIQ